MAETGKSTVFTELLSHILKFRNESWEAGALRRTQLCLQDSLGCYSAGRLLKHFEPSIAAATELFGQDEDGRLSTFAMAYLYGQAANLLDYDDTLYYGHPGAAIIGAVLSVCVRERLSTNRLLRGIAAGYQAQFFLATSAASSSERAALVRSVGIWDTVAAAIAISVALEHGDKMLERVVGVAVTHSMLPYTAKWYERPVPGGKNNLGWAAAAAVLSVNLALMGQTGVTQPLEGETGMWRMAGSDRWAPDPALFTKPAVLRVGFKRFPACWHLQGYLTGLSELLKLLEPDDEVTRIVVGGPEEIKRFCQGDIVNPTDIAFSLPATFSLLIAGVEPGPQWACVANEADALRYMDAFQYEPSTTRSVTVHTKDGNNLTGTVAPSNLQDLFIQGLDENGVRSKYDRLAEPTLHVATADALFVTAGIPERLYGAISNLMIHRPHVGTAFKLGLDSPKLVQLYKSVNSYQLSSAQELLKKVPQISGMRVLDIACGTGEFASLMADLVEQEGEVVGVDQSQDRIDVANQIDKKNLRFIAQDAHHLPQFPAGHFDLITISAAFHLLDQDRILAECHRLMSPMAHLLISTGSAEHPILAEKIKTRALSTKRYQAYPQIVRPVVKYSTRNGLVRQFHRAGLRSGGLSLCPGCVRTETTEEMVDVVDAGWAGNYMGNVPEEIRPAARSDTARGFESLRTVQGIEMKTMRWHVVANKLFTDKSGITIVPFEADLGADILGFNFDAQTPDQVETVHLAWLEYGVLRFRGYDISDKQQIAFARKFGEIAKFPQQRLGNSELPWQTDIWSVERPPAAVISRADQLPVQGEETCFANMYSAYDMLTDKQAIEGREIQFNRVYDTTGALRSGQQPPETDDIRVWPHVRHPIIRTHEETGRKCLYVGVEDKNNWIVGLPLEESADLLSNVFDCIRQPEVQFRQVWRQGDMVMWDSRCVLQLPALWPTATIPIIHSIAIEGERPSYVC